MSLLFDKVCFTCLKKAEKLLPIAVKDFDNIPYINKLLACYPNTVQNIRMLICVECTRMLRTCYYFRTTFVRAQATWATYNPQTDKKFRDGNQENEEDETNNDDKESAKDESESEDDGDASQDYVDNGDDDDDDSDSSDSNPPPKQKEEDVKVDLKCDKCNTQYDTLEKFSKHGCIKVEDPPAKTEDKRRWICDVCFLEFGANWKLTKHKREAHCEEKVLECNVCSKTFIKDGALKKHLTSHEEEGELICKLCNKKLKTKYTFMSHMKNHVSPIKKKNKPYLCTICGKHFPYNNSAARHMRMHLGIKRFSCNICNKKFSQMQHLKTHERVHTGEKPFVCEFCGEAFAFRASYNKHKALHTDLGGEKPFVCEFCGESFSFRAPYNRHKSQHQEQGKIYPMKVNKPRPPTYENVIGNEEMTTDTAWLIYDNNKRPSYDNMGFKKLFSVNKF